MKTEKITIAIALLCTVVVAGVPPDPPPRRVVDAATRAAMSERRNSLRAQRLAADGGLVVQPSTGKVFRVVNLQKRVSVSAVRTLVDDFQRILRIPVEMVSAAVADEHAAVVMTIKDDEATPTILVAPEDMWVTLNIGRLCKDNPSVEILNARFSKEFWRGACMVLGAYVSMGQPCVMQPMTSLQDIDAYKPLTPTPEPFSKMLAVARKIGIQPFRRTSYRKACAEGWAPAPTNDVQRAIFEQVKADKERGPTNPITIPPPNAAK